jgi:hypothetical protein
MTDLCFFPMLILTQGQVVVLANSTVGLSDTSKAGPPELTHFVILHLAMKDGSDIGKVVKEVSFRPVGLYGNNRRGI